MRFELVKFGEILYSRQSGQSDSGSLSLELNNLKDDEEIILDFKGIKVLSPSWADEIITPLIERCGIDRVKLINTDNVSVQSTLKFISKVRGFELDY